MDLPQWFQYLIEVEGTEIAEERTGRSRFGLHDRYHPVVVEDLTMGTAATYYSQTILPKVRRLATGSAVYAQVLLEAYVLFGPGRAKKFATHADGELSRLVEIIETTARRIYQHSDYPEGVLRSWLRRTKPERLEIIALSSWGVGASEWLRPYAEREA